MANPVLVIMAAGMGSRYGGLKQIDPIGPNGQILLDYSIYDAHRAGFDRVVFIIRPELHEAFEDAIGKKARRFMQVDYAYQTLDNLPDGLTAPEGREKPLGTAHAVWCAKELTAGCPIAVINADDFYGADAFRKMYDYLASAQDDDKFRIRTETSAENKGQKCRNAEQKHLVVRVKFTESPKQLKNPLN